MLELALRQPLEGVLALVLGQRLEDDEKSVDGGGGRHTEHGRSIRAANRGAPALLLRPGLRGYELSLEIAQADLGVLERAAGAPSSPIPVAEL